MEQAKGHEFHYSTFEADADLTHAYEAKGDSARNKRVILDNLVAGYTHFHFASNPNLQRTGLMLA